MSGMRFDAELPDLGGGGPHLVGASRFVTSGSDRSASATAGHPAGTSPPRRRPVLARVPTEPGGDDLVLEIRGDRRRSARTLWLTGELCVLTAPVLARCVEEHSFDVDVVLDTGGVTFVDSTGITTFVELVRRWRARGRSLRIVNPSARVSRVVAILALEDELFGAAPTTPPAAEPEPVVRVRNLERGQVVEVVVEGTVTGSSRPALRRRLTTLASARQPAVLRVDLRAATVDPGVADDLIEIAGVLDPFGSRLVVLAPDAALEQAVAAQGSVRSLTFSAVPTNPSSP